MMQGYVMGRSAVQTVESKAAARVLGSVASWQVIETHRQQLAQVAQMAPADVLWRVASWLAKDPPAEARLLVADALRELAGCWHPDDSNAVGVMALADAVAAPATIRRD